MAVRFPQTESEMTIKCFKLLLTLVGCIYGENIRERRESKNLVVGQDYSVGGQETHVSP